MHKAVQAVQLAIHVTQFSILMGIMVVDDEEIVEMFLAKVKSGNVDVGSLDGVKSNQIANDNG